MAVTGPKPTGRAILSGNTPKVDWTDVVNVPYTGPKPELPLERQAMLKNGDMTIVPMGQATLDWWDAVTSMPHCSLWTRTDWQFCLDTAKVHSAAMTGSMPAVSELRQRERILGTTVDFRRDLRIRYVEPEVKTVLEVVTNIDNRRNRLADA